MSNAISSSFTRSLVPLACLLLIGLLGACDGSGPESSNETDETLEPGGTATTESGVHLMASRDALGSPTPVSAAEAPDPTDETPLPDAASAPGVFYRVAGGRTVDLSSQDPPLYVALPVPDDADPANLSLGVRVPRSHATEADPSSPAYGWSTLPGAYEPERDLLVVPTPFLVSDGVVLTVLESPTYDTPSMEGTSGESLFEKTNAFFSQGTSTVETASHGGGFKIKCKGFSGSGCGSAEKDSVRSYLQEAHSDYVSGFRSPDIKTPLFSNKYVWIIKKKGKAWCKGQTAGKYLSLTNTAITCFDGGSGSPPEGTTRHEFFHAIQYNYAPISWSKLPKQRPNWVIEATADIAESPKSDASTAVRSGGTLRTISTPLQKEAWKPNFPSYRAKDFWVYLINNRNSTPSATLDPLFQAQSNAPNAPKADKVDQLYSLNDAHWGWVTNQTFESRVKTGYSGKLSPNCVLDSSVVDLSEIAYDAGARSSPKTKSMTLDALSAKVVGVTFENNSSNRVTAKASANTSDDESYAKTYFKHSSATTSCWNRGAQSASAQISEPLLPGQETTFYVLVSNSRAGDQSTFDVEVTHEDRPTK